jgi:hypothetical protein
MAHTVLCRCYEAGYKTVLLNYHYASMRVDKDFVEIVLFKIHLGIVRLSKLSNVLCFRNSLIQILAFYLFITII